MQSVKRTSAIQPSEDMCLTMAGFGLVGETGEVVDTLKKHLFQGHNLSREVMIDELGDVLWYWTLLCMCCDTTPDEVMAENVHKLERRYPEGFNAERSIHRENEG